MASIRDEYAPTFGRQHLTLWEGPFASEHVGSALELPGHDGFMVDLGNGSRVRVSCPAPRTADNFETVDAAINAAVKGA
jgi:hypothetical protein